MSQSGGSNTGWKHRGARNERCDYFDDVMSDNKQHGIFAGEGIEDFEGLKVEPQADGISCGMHCRGCSAQADVVLSWPEIWVIGTYQYHNMLPQDWSYSQTNQAAFPANTRCPRCDFNLVVHIKPMWAKAQIDEALRTGLVSGPALQQDPQVQSVAQAMAQINAQRRHGQMTGQR